MKKIKTPTRPRGGTRSPIPRGTDGTGGQPRFQGLVVPQKQMVEVKVKGRALSEYRLNFYHSVRFTATKPQKATIDALVAADRRSAKGTEERKKGRNASTILTLPQRGKTNRFLCYLTKQKRKGRRDHPRLHGGGVSNIDELRRLIE